MRKLIIVVIALVVLLLVFFVARSATPVVELPSAVSSLGQATPITVHVRDPHGIRRLRAFVEQNGARYQVFAMAQPSKSPDSTWDFTAGVKTTPQLQAGNAKLIVEATSNDLLRKTGRAERDLTVVTQPPMVSVDSEQHYLYLGMADLATFNVSGNWTEAGVRVGNEKFRAWPVPGGKPGLFSMFAFAWNMPADTVSELDDEQNYVRFQKTPKMSSYLLFLAIGELERLEAVSGSTIVSLVARKGSAGKGRFALEH